MRVEIYQKSELPRNGMKRISPNLFFGATIVISAFLLFQIEPMISKYILPWFGGGPAVWTAAMLFFQVLLLGGYAYAHFLSRLSLARQSAIHLVVSLAILVWMGMNALRWSTPVTPDASWKPTVGAAPVLQVLLVLLVSIGLPFFLLSTTSSLVQSWFSRMRQQASPYAFYVLSNAASLIALLSYPVFFEPNWTLTQQGNFWSIGFGIYLLALGGCIVTTRSGLDRGTREPESGTKVGKPDDKAPTWRTSLFWISLAACASVMLLASTNQMCQDIASIPFLWVLPLSLYLLSFVIAFNDNQKKLRGLYALLSLAALALGLWNLATGSRMGILFQIASNALMLFAICLLCHSELYLRRPSPRYLTSFYLMLSIGGAVGGIFVSLIAPLIFPDFWEYNLGLIYVAIIIIAIAYQSLGSWLHRLRIPVSVLALVLAVFILMLPIAWTTLSLRMARNFYGVLKVRALDGPIQGYSLMHGAIAHGSQAGPGPFHDTPTMYYNQSSGVGQAILNYPPRIAGKSIRIGVVGLGVGTIASYGRPGDVIRFYEIDPNVIAFAKDSRYFSFLSDSPAKVDIILGDARLSMERELAQNQPQGFDILVIDAFSGDSIPTHLLTKEAVQLYLAHLKPGGILAFNISNRHIDLEPVLALAAEQFGLPGVFIAQNNPKDQLSTSSRWVLISENADLFKAPGIAVIARDLRKTPGIRLWTDDYSNLFQVLL
jgi:SAM-dependent methyltransferase